MDASRRQRQGESLFRTSLLHASAAASFADDFTTEALDIPTLKQKREAQREPAIPSPRRASGKETTMCMISMRSQVHQPQGCPR